MDLYARINQRVEQMVAQGLFQEVEDLRQYAHMQSMQTIGYKEGLAYLNGHIDRNVAIEKIKQHTRQYAKRQITWFKYQQQTTWLSPLILHNVLENRMVWEFLFQ